MQNPITPFINPSRVLCRGIAVLACSLSTLALASPEIDPITSKAKAVSQQFFSINDHGTPSGFIRGNIDPTSAKHYQGITRHPSLGDVFFLAKSGDSNSPAAVLGVNMPGESDTRHMNHNLWAKNATNTGGTNPNDAAFTYWEDTLSGDCDHLGGIQAAGKVLAVPGENCNGGSHGSDGRVYLYNLHNTYQPELIDITADGSSAQDSANVGFASAGAVGIIEDSENLYTVMVFTDGNKRVRFRQFELIGNSMTATSDWLTFVTPSNQSNGWETGTGAHQTINLVRQDDDQLYVVGTQRGLLENDYMFLYKVNGLSYDAAGHLSGAPSLAYEGKRHMACTNWKETGTRMCDLQAAAGIHVVNGANGNNNGELVLLASAHDDDKGPNNNLAPITEFRNKNIRTIDNDFGDCGTGSWATLYDNDRMGGRNITITEFNSAKDDFKYLHNGSINFGDKASAISYCIRSGCTLNAYNNSGYGSKTLSITGSGSGTYGYDNDLKRGSRGHFGANWSRKGDKISSIEISCQ
jgi:hypothetical protein